MNHAGTHAEQLTIPEDWCVSLPENLSLDEIGGLPMPALTAWQVRFLHCRQARYVRMECLKLDTVSQ